MAVYETNVRLSGIAKIIKDPALAAALKAHIEEILQGRAMSASPRSQLFLRHILEKAISGDFESLKERVIGIELYNRSPSYDKSEDAIVRVGASDVRKRLTQHYREHGDQSIFRIDLPPGSYVPEITYVEPSPISPPEQGREYETGTTEQDVHQLSDSPLVIPTPPVPVSFRSVSVIKPLIVLVLLCLSFLAGVGWRSHFSSSTGQAKLFCPWLSMAGTGRTLQIITSDPDLASQQIVTDHPVSLADYANGFVLPDKGTLDPRTYAFASKYLQGSRTANVDVSIVADVLGIVRSKGYMVTIRPARSVRLGDFHSDDDFLLLGGPLANPWIHLLDDELDFRVNVSPSQNTIDVENVHPRPGESHDYVQTGNGFDHAPPTGMEFAIIAFVANPLQHGHILVIAGTGAESTAAAGRALRRLADSL